MKLHRTRWTWFLWPCRWFNRETNVARVVPWERRWSYS